MKKTCRPGPTGLAILGGLALIAGAGAQTTHPGRTDNPHRTTVSSLVDTSLASLLSGQVLEYDGSQWVNAANPAPGAGDRFVVDSVHDGAPVSPLTKVMNFILPTGVPSVVRLPDADPGGSDLGRLVYVKNTFGVSAAARTVEVLAFNDGSDTLEGSTGGSLRLMPGESATFQLVGAESWRVLAHARGRIRRFQSATSFIARVNAFNVATLNTASITLPGSGAYEDGVELWVKHLSGAGGSITVNRSGTDLIDTGTSITLADGQAAHLVLEKSSGRWLRF